MLFRSAAYNGMLAGSLDRTRGFDAAVERFGSGATVALMATRAQAEWAVKKTGRKAVVEEWPMMGVVRAAWPIGLATRVDAHDLAYELEDALAQAADDGRLKEIHARFGVGWTPPPKE